MTASPTRRSPALSVVVALQLVACAWALRSGPITISDDDFARVTISQQFAEHPSFDPTGTSWLPLPFYLQGTFLLVSGGSLDAARVFQIALAVASATLLFVAARWLTRQNWSAAFGATLGLSIPYVAELSVATVPEYLGSALACLGLAGLALGAPEVGATDVDSNAEFILGGRRLCSALALTAACACRYEAWWLTLAGALLSLHDARRAWIQRRSSLARVLVGAALLHVAFPLAWLTHGALDHGSATFFIARVTAYKHALGEGARPLGELLIDGYVGSAIAFAPAALLVPLALGAWLRRRSRSNPAANYSSPRDSSKGGAPTGPSALLRPLGALGLMLLLLTLSELRGGAPTHHAERTVVSVWIFGGLLTATLAERLRHALPARSPERPALYVACAIAFACSALFGRAPAPFVDRSAEERIGHAIPEGARVVIATNDFGYLAVMAAAGRPSRFTVVDTNDPRLARDRAPLATRAIRMASEQRATHLVLPSETTPHSYHPTVQIGALALFERAAPTSHR